MDTELSLESATLCSCTSTVFVWMNVPSFGTRNKERKQKSKKQKNVRNNWKKYDCVNLKILKSEIKMAYKKIKFMFFKILMLFDT